MSTSLKSSLVLTGASFEPDDATRLIGLEPTKTWRTGDLVQGTVMRRKHSGWEWSTGRENALHLGEQIARLLDSLGPYLSRIGEARQIFDLEAEISCAVYIEGQAPSIHLDLGALKLINQLEAEIDLDIIVFPDPAEE